MMKIKTQIARRTGPPWLAFLLGAVGILAIPVAAFGMDLDRKVQFNIPPQNLSGALIQFSKQTRLQIIISEDITGETTPGVTGQKAIRQALSQLLEPAGLAYRVAGETAITVGKTEIGTVRASRTNYAAAKAFRLAQAEDASSNESATPPESASGLQIGEIVVTARRREERLQNVPDSITVITGEALENSGIRQVSDFAALTPNLTFQDGSAYRAGLFNLSMRGIGNGQEGWPSISFIVDGVPSDSTDSISSGSLEEIERIEVLRGPQSALYGFNAIAGAINVITKAPTSEWSFKGRALYGKDNDRQIGGALSGPIAADKALFRLSALYRDDDGLIESASNGIDLASKRLRQLSGRLLLTPADALTIDLYGHFGDERNGSSYNDKIASSALLDDFSGGGPRRRFAGIEDRRLYRLAARVQWDFEPVSLISVTGYSHVDQNLVSSLCYDDPDNPALPAPGGGAQCLFGPAFGDTAAPGQPIDNLYDGRDDFRTITQDLRLESRGDSALEWTFGASFLRRKYLAGFDAGLILAPDEAILPLFPVWNAKKDKWWGVYGQVAWQVTPKLELTAAARYDDEEYRNTTYTDRTKSTIIPVLSPAGVLIDTQEESGNAFQPKGQVSYHFTDDVMGYLTVSRGFRAGYFSTGSFTLPEHTTNYEVGLKSMLWERRVMTNFAVFHIDYSDQQFSTIITSPPYRVSLSIPRTKINGAELESTILVSRFVALSAGIGYLDAEVDDGTTSPASPRFNANVSADFTYPVSNEWQMRLHVDGRHNSSQYLSRGDLQRVSAKSFVNLRAGLESDRYSIVAYARNLTDERQAAYASVDNFAGGYPRYLNLPRSYGIEARVTF